MRGNIPIPNLPHAEDLWLVLVVTSVRERRTLQGRQYLEALARNSSGTITLKIWAAEGSQMIRPGLWGVTGRVESYQDGAQFLVAEYRPIGIEQYRTHQGIDPQLPTAYTLDIETVALPGFRERVGLQLERSQRLGKMRIEQQQRYLEDIAAEEDRCYQLGALSATTGRILSLALQIAPIAGLELNGLEPSTSELVFGIDASGTEEDEKFILHQFLKATGDFDSQVDEFVGHNILGFDLPFIYQRCLIHEIPVRPHVNLAEFNVRGVFDTMHRWWLGARRTISLDELAWAMGFDSSKTSDVEGSKIFDLYEAGRLSEIREYNLNDVRLARKVYDRMVATLGH